MNKRIFKILIVLVIFAGGIYYIIRPTANEKEVDINDALSRIPINSEFDFREVYNPNFDSVYIIQPYGVLHNKAIKIDPMSEKALESLTYINDNWQLIAFTLNDTLVGYSSVRTDILSFRELTRQNFSKDFKFSVIKNSYGFKEVTILK